MPHISVVIPVYKAENCLQIFGYRLKNLYRLLRILK